MPGLCPSPKGAGVAVGITLVLSLILVIPATTIGQCLLANPSFEVPGTGGPVFGGWNQFGPVGSSTTATHGSTAARVTPYGVDWNVAGYWQRLDTAPGQQWVASVNAWHSSPNPLTGASRAILNIEWRDSGNNIISYESHDVATASTPLDEIQEFSVTSGPAPSGTVATHLVLAVIHGPSEPLPDVFYDQATFYEITPPTMDDMQWDDFLGGRTISFSGRTWRVKGPGYFGPGPNDFTDAAGNIWVDTSDRLHLTIKKSGSKWYSTETVLEEALGYGDYIFTTVGRLDLLDPNAILGMFLWQYGPCWDTSQMWWNPYNEIDIEISRWGNPLDDIAQFVAQPWDAGGNINRFDATFSDGEITSHAFRWLKDRIEYRSWRGGPLAESSGNMIHGWTYTGFHIPRPEQPRVHINLWHIAAPATDQEVILDEFTFVPAGSVLTDVSYDHQSPGSLSRLFDATPNPFNPSTTIRYLLTKTGQAEITVYDVQGRFIRTLVSGFMPNGQYSVTWDGRNDLGARVASGVYLYRLRTADIVETKKMVLLK